VACPPRRRRRGSRDGPAARTAGIAISGATPVVEHGKVDRLYITTTGIGTLAGIRFARSVRAGTDPPLRPHRRSWITILRPRRAD
jgi:hypothetical protein